MKTFFASLFGTIAGLLFVAAASVGVIVIIFVAAASSAQKVTKFETGSYLVFNLDANLTDTPPALNASGVLIRKLAGGGGEPATLQVRAITRALHEAAGDDRVAGLVLMGNLQPDGYGTGYAALKEVRAAIQEFKAAHKPVIAYLDDADTRDFYIAAGADEVLLDPYGVVFMPGLATEPMFYFDAMQKYGVGVQVTRTGPYKSYAEPFLRDNLSPENREQLTALLGDLWTDLLADVAKDRGLKPADLQKLIDTEGIIRPEAAKAAGLITGIAYRDEVIAELKKKTGREGHDDTFKQVSLADYIDGLPKEDGSAKKGGGTSGPTIAILYAEGAIVDGEGGSGEVGDAKFARELRDLRQDDNVKAIVLRVNSPGGSAAASEHIQRELRLALAAKPLVVSMGSYAASGGYWISAYAKRVFAEPTTITGSIGVVGLHFNIQKLANDFGLTFDGVKTGRFADLATASRPKTDEELAVFQRMVDWIYGEFIRKVAEGRKLAPEVVSANAQGRVWSGTAALKLGLIDEIGGLNQALAYAAKEAKLNGSYQVTEFPQSRDLSDVVADALADHNAPESRLPGLVSKLTSQLKAEAAALEQFNDPLGVYARLPFELRVR